MYKNKIDFMADDLSGTNFDTKLMETLVRIYARIAKIHRFMISDLTIYIFDEFHEWKYVVICMDHVHHPIAWGWTAIKTYDSNQFVNHKATKSLRNSSSWFNFV